MRFKVSGRTTNGWLVHEPLGTLEALQKALELRQTGVLGVTIANIETGHEADADALMTASGGIASGEPRLTGPAD